jgi:hypothetical protein
VIVMTNIFVRLAASALLAAFTASSPALTQDRTPAGVPFIIGGIGAEEAAALETQLAYAPFSLALRTAAHGSGAYLADVDLSIQDEAGQQVFQRRLDGPYLLIDLPPGRYVLVGVHQGQVERMTVTLPRSGRRSAVMYFVVEGETRPHGHDED